MQGAPRAVLQGGHPSPQANGVFFFCKSYFACANTWLGHAGRGAVRWDLTSAPNPTTEACVWSWDSSTRTSACQSTCTLAECPFSLSQ
ncbi:MAG: hypothetical protein WCK73_15805 [Deltaproteobacteria bacterium]